jgi:hypothetical protein
VYEHFAVAGACRTAGILSYFDSNVTRFETVAQRGASAVRAALNVDMLPNGVAVSPETAFAETSLTNGVLESARLASWVRLPVKFLLSISSSCTRICRVGLAVSKGDLVKRKITASSPRLNELLFTHRDKERGGCGPEVGATSTRSDTSTYVAQHKKN